MKKILSLIKKGILSYFELVSKNPYNIPTGTIPLGI